MVMKRAAGVFCLIAGAFCIAVEFLWTTAEKRNSMGLPEGVAVVLVFVMGLTGLALLYGGWRLVRSR